MKECQGRFHLLFVAQQGVSNHVALVRDNESKQKDYINCWQVTCNAVCTWQMENLHTVRLGTPASPEASAIPSAG